MVRQKEVEIIEQEYLFELQRIKNTINENQNKAMVIVNSAAIINNYEIGTIINERKVWGNKYIEKLANDLKNYGKGYSKRNLEYMTQLANNFTFEEITKQLVSQISWGSIVKIMQKSKTHEEMI